MIANTGVVGGVTSGNDASLGSVTFFVSIFWFQAWSLTVKVRVDHATLGVNQSNLTCHVFGRDILDIVQPVLLVIDTIW